jgi:hypothetical protein
LTADRFGIPNSAYSFNGTSDYIETVNALPDMQSASASCWISAPAFSSRTIFLLMDGDTTPGHDFGMDMDGTTTPGHTNVFLFTKDGPYCEGSFPLLTNTWFHFVAVADTNAKVLKMWVNGQLMGTTPSLGNANVGYHSLLCIGCRAVYHDFNFNGSIDDVRIYNRALSDSEVQQLYAYESATCPPPLITSQPRGQVGYWGKSVSLGVSAVGVPPLSYQWLKGGTSVQGASGSSLVLTNLQMTDAGNYSVVITNACGSSTSSNAYLTVNPAGVSVALYSGVTIDGVVGLTYGVQYNTDLSNTNGWHGLANITLSVPTEVWFDLQPASRPQRFYRVVPGPISIP